MLVASTKRRICERIARLRMGESTPNCTRSLGKQRTLRQLAMEPQLSSTTQHLNPLFATYRNNEAAAERFEAVWECTCARRGRELRVHGASRSGLRAHRATIRWAGATEAPRPRGLADRAPALGSRP